MNMKAWTVKPRDEDYMTIVFAETAEKAKVNAMETYTCEDSEITDIEVKRCPEMDKCYKDGKIEADWNDPDDRKVMCEDLGFHCTEPRIEECKECVAKEFCDYSMCKNPLR